MLHHLLPLSSEALVTAPTVAPVYGSTRFSWRPGHETNLLHFFSTAVFARIFLNEHSLASLMTPHVSLLFFLGPVLRHALLAVRQGKQLLKVAEWKEIVERKAHRGRLWDIFGGEQVWLKC